MKTLRREIHPEIRIVDAKRGLVDYVASDESLDAYSEVIRASGWRFTHFKKNAPFVDSHDYGSIEKLLGSVKDFRVEKAKLINRTQWAVDVPENRLAQIGWKMTEAGHLKAVSVGFFPVKELSPHEDPRAWQTACAEAELDPEAAKQCRRIYLEQEQIELSACIIGANPNALVQATKAGIVSDDDLAAVGFGEDGDRELLESCAAAWDHADALTRALIARELRAIHATFKAQQTTTAPSAITPGDAEAASRRERFLAEFRAATAPPIRKHAA